MLTLDPFYNLYQTSFKEISQDDFIQEFWQQATDLTSLIDGEFEGNLNYYEFQFRLNRLNFAWNGLILARIRHKRAYKREYSSFTDYCHHKIGHSRSHCDRLINAAWVITFLIRHGFHELPRNESQCRLLYQLPQDDIVHCWKEFLKTCKPHEITASKLEAYISGQKEKSENSEHRYPIPEDLYKKVLQASLRIGLSVNEWLSKLLYRCFGQLPENDTNWQDFKKCLKWSIDDENWGEPDRPPPQK